MEDVCQKPFPVCFGLFIQLFLWQVPEGESPEEGQLTSVRSEETENLNS